MAQPSSPFDEPTETAEPAPAKPGIPERKWSFVSLAVVLFVLVWFRELTGMPPTAMLVIAGVILFIWIMLFVTLYVIVPTTQSRRRRETEHAGVGSSGPAGRTVRWLTTWWLWSIGLVLGFWLPFFLPIDPVSFTLLLLLNAILMSAMRLLVAWLGR